MDDLIIVNSENNINNKNTNIQIPIKDFLDFLYPTISTPSNGWFSLWETPGKSSKYFDVTKPGWQEAVAAQAQEWDHQKHNVFYGLGLRGADLGPYHRGKKKDIVVMPGLWVDIDIQGPGHKGTNYPTGVAAIAEKILIPFGVEPSRVVLSGGGLHVYWAFDQPLTITDENRAEVTALSKAWQARLIAHAAAAGWGMDDTADLTRVLRPVGTNNHKTDTPRPVAFIGIPGPRYSYAALRAVIPPTGATVPAPTATGATVPAPTTLTLTTPVPTTDESTATISGIWRKLGKISDPTKREIVRAAREGRPLAEPGSRDITIQRLASWIAAIDQTTDPEVLAEAIMGRSIAAMAGQTPDDCPTIEDAAKKIARAQNEMAEKTKIKNENNAKILALFQGAEPEEKESRPVVWLGADEARVTADVLSVISSALLQRHGQLVVLVSDTGPLAGVARPLGSPVIRPISRSALRLLISSRVFLARGRDKVDNSLVEGNPPDWLVAGIHDMGTWPTVRHLEGIVESEVIGPDHKVIDQPGYHDTTGLFVVRDYTDGDRPATVEAAKNLLDEAVVNFPFSGDAEKAVWVSALLTGFALHAFRGPIPFFLFDANQRGTGKSRLIDLISIIQTGHVAPRKTYADADDEMRKTITAIMLEGLHLVMLDNIGGRLGCPSLEAAVTGVSWHDRRLGSNSTVSGPLRVIWLASGNNTELSSDLTRRTLHCRLESALEDPEKRDDLLHPDLYAWVTQNRGRIVGACLAILDGYIRAGEPNMGLPPFGSFEDWSKLIRSAVVWAGFADPCATREALRERADTDRSELAGMIAGIRELDPKSAGKNTKEIITAGTTPGKCPVLAAALAEVTPGHGQLTPKVLGRRLRQLCGRPRGGYAIQGRVDRNGMHIWRVEPVIRGVA